ncbi:MAG: AAA family ATPase [Verrucomicrobia bacterium]|nr:AAA family ATPase [Verrucomicrobiota bacterium]
MATTIAITGKGGTGKTIVSALIIKHLKEHAAGPILALDADPDANLGTVLGIPIKKTIGDLREETLEKINDLPAGLSRTRYIEAGLHQIIAETPKVDLIAMGRSEGPGCYCYVNSILRKFAEDLETSYEWVVMDNEAGLEHLSRRTAARVDHMIVVVNKSPLSVDCAKRIDKLISELKNEIGRKYVLLDGVGEEKIAPLRARLNPLPLEYLGNIPYDQTLEDCVFMGKSLFELDGGPAVSKMNEIMKKIRET